MAHTKQVKVAATNDFLEMSRFCANTSQAYDITLVYFMDPYKMYSEQLSPR
jgi:hypothetical protein